jgi:hypothetical protein
LTLIARRFVCFLFNLFTPLIVFAANPVMWNVDISTTGEDVSWTSPTAITPGLPEYDYSYEITELTANVALFGNRDLLGLLDETSGTGTTTAFPFEVLEEMLDEPTTNSSADIRIAVDAAGIGHASGTNIELGSFLGLPIRGVDLMATVFILGIPTGDYDRDGDVDAGDYAVWRSRFGSTVTPAADGNKNSVIDAADYVVWRNNLGVDTTPASGLAAALPEPSNWFLSLAFLSALPFASRFRCYFRQCRHRHRRCDESYADKCTSRPD